MLPTITAWAPAAIALARSPEWRTPPSATTRTPVPRSARATSAMALSCGTPTPGDHARRADGPRADADLDRVGAGAGQRAGRLGGGDVARHQLRAGVPGPEPAHGLDHRAGVAVRGVQHQGVGAGGQQGRGALLEVRDAHRGGHPQLPGGVLAGVRAALRAADVARGHHAAQREALVDHQHALDAPLAQQPLDQADVAGVGDRDQALPRRHQVAHRQAGGRVGVAGVPAGDDAGQAPGVGHRQAGDGVLGAQRQQLAERGAGPDRDRVAHHPALVPLDRAHRRGLRADVHVAVHRADAALPGQRDRHGRLGDGVHRRGHQGHRQADPPGQGGADVGAVGGEFGVARAQQHVVEGERVRREAQHRSRGLGRGTAL